MRRTLALLLIALFSVSLFTPLFAADERRELPACCRRDGQHHCSMPSHAADQSDHTALHARCSLYRGASSFFSGPRTASVAAPTGFQALQRCAANVADQIDSVAVSAVFGSPDSRGPPSFLE
jgi:hypothetical protein